MAVTRQAVVVMSWGCQSLVRLPSGQGPGSRRSARVTVGVHSGQLLDVDQNFPHFFLAAQTLQLNNGTLTLEGPWNRFVPAYLCEMRVSAALVSTSAWSMSW